MTVLRKALLVCGILASLVYVGIDVLAAIRYPGYHSFTSRAISELMASGAPTERLVDPLFLFYDALMLAFAAGVWMSGPGKRARLTAALLLGFAALGALGPTLFEMNVRGSGADASADVLHIAVTGILVLLILGIVTAGASLGGQAFRLYSLGTVLVMVVFGLLTSLASRGLGTGEPTPWLGVTERIDIGAFLLWVAVLALLLLRAHAATGIGDGLRHLRDGLGDGLPHFRKLVGGRTAEFGGLSGNAEVRPRSSEAFRKCRSPSPISSEGSSHA